MANTYDWLTLNEGKIALSIPLASTKFDTIVASAISGLSRRLDQAVGPAVQYSVSSEAYNGGWRSIELKSSPVSAISSIVEYQRGTAVSLTQVTPGSEPEDGYYSPKYVPQTETNFRSGIIYRVNRSCKVDFYPGVQNIVVSYTAGRYASTSLVDSQFKEACAVALKNWYRMYQESSGRTGEFAHPTENFPKFVVPNATRLMLHHVWKPEVGFGGEG